MGIPTPEVRSMHAADTSAWALLGLLAMGCNPPDLDEDGDGFTELTDECDDSDPNVHPDAVEVCGNDKDDNCNGELDELGATSGRIWYADLDGDGFGDEENNMLRLENRCGG